MMIFSSSVSSVLMTLFLVFHAATCQAIAGAKDPVQEPGRGE